jgi:hypothetical protein
VKLEMHQDEAKEASSKGSWFRSDTDFMRFVALLMGLEQSFLHID